jgi:Na+/proline symporter
MIGLSLLDLIILIGYFAVIILVGVISTRLIRSREDYLMGGRRFGKLLMVFFTFGSGTHADSAVGVTAQSYKVGLSGIWYQWVMLLTLPLYWLLAPVFRRARVMTTADYFERRFGEQFALLYAVFGLFVCITFTSVGLYGSSQLVEALTKNTLDWRLIAVVMGIFSFVYGITGGLIATVWNDCFQGILTIVMSLLIIPFFWHHIGGQAGFQRALPDPYQAFSLVLSKDMTLYWIIMMSINSLASMVAQPHIMSNIGAGKSEMDSRCGFVGGMILKRILTVPWALTGVMAIAMFGVGHIKPDHAFGVMARELLPNGFSGLMVACVLASTMNNKSVLMLSFSGIYTNSIHKKIWPHLSDEGYLLRLSRWISIVFAIITITLTLVFRDMTAAMRFTWLTVPLMGIPFFLGLLWKRANRYGAFASFLFALAAMLIGKYVFNWDGDAGLPKNIALFLSTGITGGVLVSLVTAPEPRRKIEQFFLLLRTPIGQEDLLRRAGLTQIPGTGTFEYVCEDVPKAAKLADAKFPGPTTEAEEIACLEPDLRQSRKESRIGAGVMLLVTLGMLAAVICMANWLRGGR